MRENISGVLLGICGSTERDLVGDRMQAEFEVHDDAEISTAALQRPQQIGIFLIARTYQIAACSDQIGGNEIVA
ncbi:MAG: hypothetical protein AAAB11_20230, partial [Rhizobium giardinii]